MSLRDCQLDVGASEIQAMHAVGIYIHSRHTTWYSGHDRNLHPLAHQQLSKMSTNGTQNLEQGNRAYVAEFTQGDLALPPSQKYAVLTCMDARIDPAVAFGQFK